MRRLPLPKPPRKKMCIYFAISHTCWLKMHNFFWLASFSSVIDQYYQILPQLKVWNIYNAATAATQEGRCDIKIRSFNHLIAGASESGIRPLVPPPGLCPGPG